MRVVVQRVKRCSVTVDNSVVSEIGKGLLLLVGITDDDTQEDIDYLVKKVSQLRIFDDESGVMNLSVKDIDGDVLSVSQFTLYASTKKGNRPSYIRAAKGEVSEGLYQKFRADLAMVINKPVPDGVFGAYMDVDLVNDGPVTIIIDSKQRDF